MSRAQYVRDLSKGYRQVNSAPDVKEMAALRNPFDMHQFRVMPFGWEEPAIFQRPMDHVLRDVSDCAPAYLGDSYFQLIMEGAYGSPATGAARNTGGQPHH